MSSNNINPIVYQIVNLLAIIATLIVNILVNVLPLNGVNTGQVSDSYPNLFTPPGYVFAIWGIIYALLIAFMLFQVRANQRQESYFGEISFLYVFGGIANIVWLFIFHYSYGVPSLFLLSIVPMIVLLLTLLITYLRLGIGLREVSLGQKLAVHLPVSVYLGWISLATIANTASALNVLVPGIPMATQEIWTAIIIVVALIITVLMLYSRRDIAFGLVVIWASVGIAIKQAAIMIIFATAIGVALIVAAVILLLPLIKKTNPIDFYLIR